MMASRSPPARSGLQDDFEDLFRDDPEMEAAFRELDANTATQITQNERTTKGNSASADVAIDEEIKIVKKRQPIPKLDAPLLLSPAGIPKLRRISKDRLRLKGKGHEYSDVARLLNTYQLWLDDLYPRAKFADALTIIEKLGHSKQMQMMRKVWIEEGKPKGSIESEEDMDDSLARGHDPLQARSLMGPEVANSGSEGGLLSSERHATTKASDGPDEEELNALLAENEPDEDELDALLAEQDAMDMEVPSIRRNAPTAQPSSLAAPQDDELDALLAEEDALIMEPESFSKVVPVRSSRPQTHTAPDEDEYADDLEAMGDMW